jgi:hypothetical protein
MQNYIKSYKRVRTFIFVGFVLTAIISVVILTCVVLFSIQVVQHPEAIGEYAGKVIKGANEASK